jgi:hypothetical protein
VNVKPVKLALKFLETFGQKLELPYSAYLVLLNLASHTSKPAGPYEEPDNRKTGFSSYPSLRTIARECGMPRPVVQRAIKRLRETQIVTVRRGRARSSQRTYNVYDLHFLRSDESLINESDYGEDAPSW